MLAYKCAIPAGEYHRVNVLGRSNDAGQLTGGNDPVGWTVW